MTDDIAPLTKVRTTITPGEVIEVNERELNDLDLQGLILSREGDENWVDDQDEEPTDEVASSELPVGGPGKPAEDDEPGTKATKGATK